MGHIVVMDDSEAQFALTRYSQILWDELCAELPQDVEYERCGTIWVAADEQEMAEVRRKYDYYQRPRRRRRNSRFAIASTMRSRTCARRLPGASGARRLRGLSAARRGVLDCRKRAGLRCAHHSRPEQWSRSGRARAVCAMARVFAPRFFVNAAGQSAPRLTPGITIKPRKGHLVITDRYPDLSAINWWSSAI